VTLVAVFNVGKADDRYVTLLSAWCASLAVMTSELAGVVGRNARRSGMLSVVGCVRRIKCDVVGTSVLMATVEARPLGVVWCCSKCGMRNRASSDGVGGVTKEERASEDLIHLQRTSFGVTSYVSTQELHSSLARSALRDRRTVARMPWRSRCGRGGRTSGSNRAVRCAAAA